MGDFFWAAGLLRRYPSILGVVIAIVVLSGSLWPLFETMPQTWPVGTGVFFFIGTSATVLRAYTVAVTTAVLQGSVQSAQGLLVTSIRRLPAVIGIITATLVIGGVAIGIASLLTWAAIAAVPIASDSIYDGASATLVFGSISALAIFKFWLAPEVSVAGNYGPLAALRVSWAVTSLHPFRVLVVILGFVLTVFSPELIRHGSRTVGFELLLRDPLAGFVQALFYGVGYAVWFAVGTQIYIRATLS